MKLFTTTLFLLGLALMMVSGLLLMVRRQPVKSAWIWYVSAQDGDIYRMWMDGSHSQRITDSPGRKMQLAISPDGQRVAYVSDQDGNDEIYVMSVDGSQPQRLTHVPDFDGHPAWSPDGEWLAFYSGRDENAEIYKMRADGSQQTRLTDRSGFDGQPTWSPDGKWIVYMANVDANNDIYRIPAAGGHPQRLTTNPDYDGTMAFSPDGDWLVFTSVQGDSDYFHLYKMHPDGSGQTAITSGRIESGYFDGRWTPDGKWITFWGGSDGNFQIFRVRPDGSELSALTEPGPFLGPVPSRIVGQTWRGPLLLLLGLVIVVGSLLTRLGRIHSDRRDFSQRTQ